MSKRTGRGAAVIVMVEGKVLVISRGHDTSVWVLPGGNVEPYETFEQGARRELLEETGVSAHEAALVPVIANVKPLSRSVIYVAQGELVLPRVLKSQPFEGHVTWMEPRAFLASPSPYQVVNQTAFALLGLRPGSAITRSVSTRPSPCRP